MCLEDCDGEKWGARGCPACGAGPRSALSEAKAVLLFPEEDHAEAAAPRGITGPCAPHSPGVGTREQAEHVRGCAGVLGPRAVISGKHLPSGECASLDQRCPPTRVSVTSLEACVSSCGRLTQRPESRCRETKLSSLNRARETEVTWRNIL